MEQPIPQVSTKFAGGGPAERQSVKKHLIEHTNVSNGGCLVRIKHWL